MSIDKPNAVGYVRAGLYLDKKHSTPGQIGLVSNVISTPNTEPSTDSLPSLDELALQQPHGAVETTIQPLQVDISPSQKAQIIQDAIRAQRRYIR